MIKTIPEGTLDRQEAAPAAAQAVEERKLAPVVVAGASGGIGRGLVEGLLQKGYQKVIALYHTPDHAEALKQIFQKSGQEAADRLVCVDITQEGEVAAAIADVASRFGAIGSLINCAGTSSNALSWKLSSEEFLRIQKVNLLGPFHLCKAVLPGMRERSKGRIVNISSILSEKAVPGTTHYSSSKAGLNAMTRAMAAEVATKGITVNSVALGYFEVGMIEAVPERFRQEIVETIPKKRFGRVRELVALIDYLLSDEADYMTGQVLHLNGGLY